MVTSRGGHIYFLINMEKFKYYIIFAPIIIFLFWTSKNLNIDIIDTIRSIPNFFDLMKSAYPPDISILPKIVKPLFETIQIALVSIILASIISLPCALLASKNIVKNKAITQTMKVMLGVLRGIPPLLYALIFISVVGLGPLAGILALVAHVTGALGRFMSESIETADMNPIEAMKIDGANRLQIIIYGIIPNIAPLMLGYILYYAEYCIRTSTILGLVGAGGIGSMLMNAIHLFQFRKASMIFLVILVIIIVTDKLSSMLRTKIIDESRMI